VGFTPREGGSIIRASAWQETPAGTPEMLSWVWAPPRGREVVAIWLQNPGFGVGGGLCVAADFDEAVGLARETTTSADGATVAPEDAVVVGPAVVPDADGL